MSARAMILDIGWGGGQISDDFWISRRGWGTLLHRGKARLDIHLSVNPEGRPFAPRQAASARDAGAEINSQPVGTDAGYFGSCPLGVYTQTTRCPLPLSRAETQGGDGQKSTTSVPTTHISQW
jgi:hypothetical protein